MRTYAVQMIQKQSNPAPYCSTEVGKILFAWYVQQEIEDALESNIGPESLKKAINLGLIQQNHYRPSLYWNFQPAGCLDIPLQMVQGDVVHKIFNAGLGEMGVRYFAEHEVVKMRRLFAT